MLVNSVAYCGSCTHIYLACDFVCCVMVSMLFAWCGLVVGGVILVGLVCCCVVYWLAVCALGGGLLVWGWFDAVI